MVGAIKTLLKRNCPNEIQWTYVELYSYPLVLVDMEVLAHLYFMEVLAHSRSANRTSIVV
jgi:hypothetical protein